MAFSIAITVIGCTFCLMNVRIAALLLLVIVIPPSLVVFFLSGHPVFIAISISLLAEFIPAAERSDRIHHVSEVVLRKVLAAVEHWLGTGFSSLNYLHRLPLNKIKIDRSFVTDIEHDPGTRKLVKSILHLCRSLEPDCVAEGVETAAQASILTRLGCVKLQGYYFGKPMSAHDALREMSWAREPGSVLSR